MAQLIEVANIEIGRDDSGRKHAVVTFMVTADNDPLPNPQDFSVEILVEYDGDLGRTVALAKLRVHQLFHDLREATREWKADAL